MNRIELNSEIMTGKPVIKGTRLTVELILKLLSQGQGLDAIIETYPYITKEDILACIEYAKDSGQARMTVFSKSLFFKRGI
ncbi:MAG: hypothetical protein UR28_C0011G0023 [Candidatus Peregrinibacteria bacterium GW2011_GWF2_33_10]|nr:MAG: hypothetical protein UR28_C0011G0023 [Candidatus Peregrinibacteria bacterium GW2011_GWF2_33_10]OGJ44300.1 MAG: hypothetical protein A2272_05575 [Candidatus Peregrinibacteria bacterium RIFOXYA12_FULL_33_12]OGJ44675.1 MAG: hypothetical protein A2263_01015 [Candidatus Peregrinibacteria bacterium RIFOXYA2_FULL_33_21]OGJ50409.1 MAG: hypothetical protein A2307_06075 [Candidatus Peregrinibacteria bacterium RIFOXYB2_FULL_33_20]